MLHAAGAVCNTHVTLKGIILVANMDVVYGVCGDACLLEDNDVGMAGRRMRSDCINDGESRQGGAQTSFHLETEATNAQYSWLR